MLLDNSGAGTFAVSTAARLPAALPVFGAMLLAATDLDRDGDDDLLRTTTWLRNDGNGPTFTAVATGVRIDAEDLRVADLTGDGRLDLIGTPRSRGSVPSVYVELDGGWTTVAGSQGRSISAA